MYCMNVPHFCHIPNVLYFIVSYLAPQFWTIIGKGQLYCLFLRMDALLWTRGITAKRGTKSFTIVTCKTSCSVWQTHSGNPDTQWLHAMSWSSQVIKAIFLLLNVLRPELTFSSIQPKTFRLWTFQAVLCEPQLESSPGMCSQQQLYIALYRPQWLMAYVPFTEGLARVGLGGQIDIHIKELPVSYVKTKQIITEICETLFPKVRLSFATV